jgi:dolichol kinase
LIIRDFVLKLGNYDDDPFIWTIFLVMDNLHMLCLWILLLIPSVILCVIWSKHHSMQKAEIMVEVARKYFHFVATLLILPGLVFESATHFLKLALACVFAVELFLEYIRAFKVWIPFFDVDLLESFIMSFTKNKATETYNRPWDSGLLVLSHLYLVLGCSFPIWLASNTATPITKACGIILIGIADSCASIFGKLYGKTKWTQHSSKSFEGSLSAILACYLILFLMSFVIEIPLKVLPIFAMSVVLEAFSLQNDNIILPLFAFGKDCVYNIAWLSRI